MQSVSLGRPRNIGSHSLRNGFPWRNLKTLYPRLGLINSVSLCKIGLFHDRETHRESGYVIALPPRTGVAEHRLHMPKINRLLSTGARCAVTQGGERAAGRLKFDILI